MSKDKKKRGARGNGTFIEREDGSYIYRKSKGLNPNGKRKYISVVGKTKAVCVKRMKEKEERLIALKDKALALGEIIVDTSDTSDEDESEAEPSEEEVSEAKDE